MVTVLLNNDTSQARPDLACMCGFFWGGYLYSHLLFFFCPGWEFLTTKTILFFKLDVMINIREMRKVYYTVLKGFFPNCVLLSSANLLYLHDPYALMGQVLGWSQFYWREKWALSFSDFPWLRSFWRKGKAELKPKVRRWGTEKWRLAR